MVPKYALDLTIPLFMYITLRFLVRKEEKHLEAVFGSAYLEYRQNVPCIIPYGCLKRPRSTSPAAGS